MGDGILVAERRSDESPAAGRTRLVLVTGMSGAGRSTALRVLEDEGYEAIDNLPLSLLSEVATEFVLQRPTAVGVDLRTLDFAVGPVINQHAELDPKPTF